MKDQHALAKVQMGLGRPNMADEGPQVQARIGKPTDINRQNSSKSGLNTRQMKS